MTISWPSGFGISGQCHSWQTETQLDPFPMPGPFFTENDLGPDSQYTLLNIPAFAADRVQWIDTLDQLGRQYGGANLVPLLEYITAYKDSNLMLLVTTSKTSDSPRPTVTSWLVAEYTGNRAVELIHSVSGSASLSAVFFRLTNLLGRSEKVLPGQLDKPDSLDSRA